MSAKQARDPGAIAIAIDGPAASGKTSVGLALAAKLGFAFLDTGLMYRAFTLAAIRAGVQASDTEACGGLAQELAMRSTAGGETHIFLGDEDVTGRLRDPEVEAAVSGYSAIPAVREAMVEQQRRIASGGRVILAGRDIGTVVLPDAPFKLYLTASEEARAARRSQQTADWGAKQQVTEARQDIARRDSVDTSRAASPLAAASDAFVVDTTGLTLEEVLGLVLARLACASA